jgi:Ubiquitin elongating factor core
MEEVVLFFTVFMGSPRHMRSPYMRSKLSEALHVWLPQHDAAGNRRPGTRGTATSELSFLFEGRQLQGSQYSLSFLSAGNKSGQQGRQLQHKQRSASCQHAQSCL